MHSIRQGGVHPEHVLATWLYANATHTIDLLRMFGGEVKHLHSITHRHQEALGDQFSATMEFESGALGTYVSHWLSPGGWRVVLYGKGVTVEFAPLEKGYWIDGVFQRHEIEPDACDQEFKPGLYRQMEKYRDLVAGIALSQFAQDLSGAWRTMLLAEMLSSERVVFDSNIVG